MFRTFSCWVLIIITCSNYGCMTGRKWGLAKKEKTGPQQQMEHDQNEAMKAMIEDKDVPRKFDDLKDPVSLQIAYAKWQEQLGQHKEAKLTYEKALDKNPNSVEAQIGLARIEQLSERYPQAERAYKKALSMDPQSPVAMHALANFYVSQERTSEAVPLMAKAVEVDPTNKTYRYEYAVTLVNTGKADQALHHMTYAVGEAEALYNVGFLLQQMGQKTEGENYMKLALMKKPELEQAKSWLDNQSPAAGPKTVLTSYAVPVTEEKLSGQQIAQSAKPGPVIQPADVPESTTKSTAPVSSKDNWKQSLTPQQLEQLKNQQSF